MTKTSKRKRRSALGIGVSTLVTILVVMLLATFSVLSLASARSDMHLSQMAAESSHDYYEADTWATRWYAELDARCVSQEELSASSRVSILKSVGYDASLDDIDGSVIVNQSFPAGNTRTLQVSIAIEDNGTTSILQWRVVAKLQTIAQ
ncbi:MAG: hypothetical protein LBG97_08040 [Coriobacteriales bacterium]|jgi:hypothetical protein|nr:hypothetical protein [Coriobacteriales bacterium]